MGIYEYEITKTDIKQNRYLQYNIEWEEISRLKYCL